VKKNRLNCLKFWKNRPVRFWFYKPETEKTEPNSNQKKTEPNRKKLSQIKKPSQTKKLSQTGLNRFCPKQSNWTETGRFEPILVFLKKINLIFFLIKTEPNQK
jgi:hypothetical protein